jgi:prolipoprotein diacylglyceryltransferase
MLHVDWDPVAHLGPIPINWYGLGWAAAFLVGGALTRRWAARAGIARAVVDDVLIWVLIGSLVGLVCTTWSRTRLSTCGREF